MKKDDKGFLRPGEEDLDPSVAATISSGQQRWGVGTIEQAFAGYAALPDPKAFWWQVLGVSQNARLDEIQAAYRALVKKHHPDAGGNLDDFIRIQMAFEQAQQEKGKVK